MPAITKVTITTSTRNYVSVDIPGNGKTDFDYDVAHVFGQLQPENFPGFTGTPEEFQTILSTSEEVKIENLGPG